MNSLAEMLIKNRRQIEEYLYIGYARWDDLISRIEAQERTSSDDFADEQIWTFLVGCGYAMAGERGVAGLTDILTGSTQREPAEPRIWFEVVPMPPRRPEGGTHVDLALGTIAIRERTKSGIGLGHAEYTWICFCEMKWYSDISLDVTHDIHRNQLARLIENALCFQADANYADTVYVTLVTPAIFRDPPTKSRLYQYKFEEYTAHPAHLVADLEACPIEPRDQEGWCYPTDLAERAASLSLRWATYDEVFENVPHSPLSAELRHFWREHCSYPTRAAPQE